MDLLAAERLIRDRVEYCVPALLGRVFSRAELDGLERRQLVTPAVHVIYAGYRALESKGAGRFARLEQRWIVAVAVKHAGDQGSGDRLREAAGPLLGDVARALLGWRPDAEHGCLALANAPAPDYRPGFAFFPLMFTVAVAVKGVSND